MCQKEVGGNLKNLIFQKKKTNFSVQAFKEESSAPPPKTGLGMLCHSLVA